MAQPVPYAQAATWGQPNYQSSWSQYGTSSQDYSSWYLQSNQGYSGAQQYYDPSLYYQQQGYYAQEAYGQPTVHQPAMPEAPPPQPEDTSLPPLPSKDSAPPLPEEQAVTVGTSGSPKANYESEPMQMEDASLAGRQQQPVDPASYQGYDPYAQTGYTAGYMQQGNNIYHGYGGYNYMGYQSHSSYPNQYPAYDVNQGNWSQQYSVPVPPAPSGPAPGAAPPAARRQESDPSILPSGKDKVVTTSYANVVRGKHMATPTGANNVPLGTTRGQGKPDEASRPGVGGVNGKLNLVIKPQMAKVNKLKSLLNSEVEAAKAAAAARSSTTPAYAAVQISTNPEAATGSAYPSTLYAFTTRALSICKNEADKALMKQEVFRLAKAAKDDGQLWIINWDEHPLPKLKDLKKRKAGEVSPESPERVLKRKGQGAGRDSAGTSSWDPKDDRRQGSKPSYGNNKSPGSSKRGRHAREVSVSSDDEGLYVEEASSKAAKGHHGSTDKARKEKRRGRFDGQKDLLTAKDRYEYTAMRKKAIADADDDEQNWEQFVIRGTMQQLEKSYFRLTSAPDPAEVRPEPVLEKALQRLLDMISRGEGKYLYYLDQFKAMRQDCTVQHLRNALAVRIYEAHARAALEYGDMGDFNQCQTQLSILYAEGIPGCHAEFAAYKLLYQTVHAKHGVNKDILTTLKYVLAHSKSGSYVGSASSGSLSSAPEVVHAMKVRQAVFRRDYKQFFELYVSCPNLGRAILDVLVPKMRWHALNVTVKAFRPTVPLPFLCLLLGFSSSIEAPPSSAEQPLPGCKANSTIGKFVPTDDVEQQIESCREYTQSHGGVLLEGDAGLDCKSSAGKLQIPEDTTKVSHGDANLALEDFLTKAIS